ncbi:phosphoribosylanthranilate isomerase [Halomicrococcus gelatinilyticus]|uniref:phosphoribosylanthranilate isomerase n=1 Tax=Halomicrococcus gelatinilyticus TaxID=1702103 RepID=UPI002E0F4A84
MTRVKVCGITSERDLQAAVDAGADAVGLLVDVPVDSPREISPGRAADLAGSVPPFVTTVLVTMPDDPGRVVELARSVDPDAVQVHGTGRGDLAFLASTLDADLVRAVDATSERPADYDGVADALLLDAAATGGTGETHDWERAGDLVDGLDSPVVLAGGLDPANVAEAVHAVDPFAVDVATGVEATGGEKDADAVRSFVANARRARRIVSP